jgi:EpsI family protein
MKPVHRTWLLALALVGTALLSQAWKPDSSAEAVARVQVPLEQVFPAAFGPWRLDPVASGLVRPAFEAARKLQMYDQVLERVYEDGQGHRIMLSAAYGRLQSVGLQMHRPEVCYRAGGFVVDGVEPARIALPEGGALPVTRLLAHMPGRHEPVTYWRLLGSHVAEDDTQFRWAQFKLGVQRALPDGMLVRVSSIDEETPRAHAMQSAFIVAMAAALQGEARERILGEAAGQPAR